MKQLFIQFMKFGFVGALCFVIDFAITMVVSEVMRGAFNMSTATAAAVGAFFGFVISVIVNYILSMKFVFERRDDMDRKKEFIIFVILSVIGLGINELIILLSIKVLYENLVWLNSLIDDRLATAGAKIIATGVVMVYNFVTRKIFIEKKQPKEAL